MEGLLNSVKGMFIKEDGGINLRTIIGMGVGAAAFAFLLPAMPGGVAIAAVVGAGAGLIGAQLLGMVLPSGESAEPAPGANVAAAAAPAHGKGHEVAVTPPQLPRGQNQTPGRG